MNSFKEAYGYLQSKPVEDSKMDSKCWMTCLFEPIEGKLPPEKLCERHKNCEGCWYCLKFDKDGNVKEETEYGKV